MSVESTSTAQSVAWRDRTVPLPEQVRPGLWAIGVPVPTPIGYTISYALEADSGVLLIDTGWPDEMAATALEEGLAVMGRVLDEVEAVVVTHLHPDHAGLVGRLLDGSPRAVLHMHPDDLDRLLPAFQPQRAEGDNLWAELMGTVGAPDVLRIQHRLSVTPILTPAQATRAHALKDGDELHHGEWTLRAVWTPGHTRGSLVLHEARHQLLFSGDHVLPTVTPTVTQQDDAGHDVLGDFLASLERIRELSVDEVLPGHQYRFRGIGDRLDDMIAHHRNRLDELVEAIEVNPGASCYDLASRLHWSTDFIMLSPPGRAMAARETLTHLTHLHLAGQVKADTNTGTTTWFSR